jgi:hypothetical protein
MYQSVFERSGYRFAQRKRVKAKIYSASLSVSPVRMRSAWSIGVTKILPSPICPVRAVAVITATALSATSAYSPGMRTPYVPGAASIWHLSGQMA